jgi:hypothetical protein
MRLERRLIHEGADFVFECRLRGDPVEHQLRQAHFAVRPFAPVPGLLAP